MRACLCVCLRDHLTGWSWEFLRDDAVLFCSWPVLRVRSPHVVSCPVTPHSLSAGHRKSRGRISDKQDTAPDVLLLDLTGIQSRLLERKIEQDRST